MINSDWPRPLGPRHERERELGYLLVAIGVESVIIGPRKSVKCIRVMNVCRVEMQSGKYVWMSFRIILFLACKDELS